MARWGRGAPRSVLSPHYTGPLLHSAVRHHFNGQVLGSVGEGTGIGRPGLSDSKVWGFYASLRQRHKLRKNNTVVMHVLLTFTERQIKN